MKNQNYIPTMSAIFAVILIAVCLNATAQSISIGFTVSDYNSYNISCHGASNGSIQPTITGGTPPYTFLWNTGDTVKDLANLAAATYILTVTDSLNATATDTVVLSAPNPLTVLLSSPLCHSSPDYNICNPGQNAGTIYSTVSGGAGGYTYSWNTGDQYATLTNAPAGNYTLMITDNNNCVDSGHIIINEPAFIRIAKPKIHSVGSVYTSCNGNPGNIRITLEGGIPPYSNVVYQTNPSATVNSYDSSGTEIFNIPYNVTYISIGLMDSEGNEVDTAITLSPAPPISATISPRVYANGRNESCYNCNNGEIVISDFSGGVSMSYASNLYLESNNSLIIIGTDTLRNIPPGSYNCVITDSVGCQSTPSVLQITAADQAEPLQVSLNAHTFAGGYNVSCHGASDGHITVTSVTGGAVPYAYLWSTGETTKNLNNLFAGTYILTVTDSNHLTVTDTVVLSQPNVIGISLTSQTYNGFNISVRGNNTGNINTTVTGGTTPYTSYSWSNGSQNASPQNLTAGIYMLTVTDANGCTASASDTLTQPAVMEINSLSSPLHNGYNVSCHSGSDGAIDLAVSGGVPVYHYSWSNGQGGSWNTQNIQNAPAGDYTVHIVDANGTEVDTGMTLTQPQALNLEFDPSVYSLNENYDGTLNISCYSCNDGYIGTKVSGGVTPYSYLWSGSNATTDSIFNLDAGTDSLTVTDANGCTVEQNITLIQPSSQDLQIVSWTVSTYSGGYNVSANGASNGSITNIIVIGGSPPYFYEWSNEATTDSLTNLTAGDYGLRIYDAVGHIYEKFVTLTQPNGMYVVLFGGGPSTNGGSDGMIVGAAVGGTPPYNFAWTASDGITLDSIESRIETLYNVSAGTYTLTVTDANGNSASNSLVLSAPSPLHVDILTSPIIAGYNISCNGGSNGSIYLTVSGGVSPYQYTWDCGSFDQNPSGLSAGTYNVRIFDNNGAEEDTSITLSQPAPLSDIINVTTYNQGSTNCSCQGCQDGSIGIDLSGGVAPYTYAWSFNQGCLQQLSQLVQSQQGSGSQLSSGSQIGSNQDSTISTADSLNNLGAGYYSVVVLDANGCELDDGTCLADGLAEAWSLGGNAGILSSQFIGTTDSTDFVIRTNNTEAMRIGADGNVGIGNPNPSAKLDIIGNGHDSTTMSLSITDDQSNPLFIVRNNGTVGIGLDPYTQTVAGTPYKLLVGGKLGANETWVSLGQPWPDYVFDGEYKLGSLESIKEYISKNKHLPEIPTEKEMKENGGINLGDMQTETVKKIEELTLYMIQLKQEVDDLKKENEELKSIVNHK